MKSFGVLLFLNLILSTTAFSHGEDKYGPNKGFIKMPGAFHTEVVPSNDGTYRVYLIDFQNKNPTVKDSNIEFQIKNGKKVTTFECKPSENLYFECSSKSKAQEHGQIILTAKRLGSQAKPVTYNLPLKLETPIPSKKDLHNH